MAVSGTISLTVDTHRGRLAPRHHSVYSQSRRPPAPTHGKWMKRCLRRWVRRRDRQHCRHRCRPQTSSPVVAEHAPATSTTTSAMTMLIPLRLFVDLS